MWHTVCTLSRLYHTCLLINVYKTVHANCLPHCLQLQARSDTRTHTWTRKMKVSLLIILCCIGVDAVTLNGGRYEDIYIVIQDSVPEFPNLIDRIKVCYEGFFHAQLIWSNELMLVKTLKAFSLVYILQLLS